MTTNWISIEQKKNIKTIFFKELIKYKSFYILKYIKLQITWKIIPKLLKFSGNTNN